MAELYNWIYRRFKNYNEPATDKLPFVIDWANSLKDCRILDCGCGKGFYLNKLKKIGKSMFGIEISKVCCEGYLTEVDHLNSNIILGVAHLLANNQKFDGVLCMDVLEHIPSQDLKETVEAMSNIAPSALYGIANHPDVFEGIELHETKQPAEYWENLLSQFYTTVKTNKLSDRFFLIYANKGVSV
jgi:SAM-dependent methyltransferase